MIAAFSTVYPSWPRAHTYAFLKQARSLIENRLAWCPAADDRPLKRYVTVDAVNGSSSGGGASGTSSDPYLVKTWEEACTLITALQVSHLAVLLKSGDVFTGAGAATSLLTITVDNVTVGTYGGSAPAIVTSFKDEDDHQAGGWTLAAGNRYTKTFTGITDFGWVRGNSSALSTVRDGLETVYTQCASTANVEATSNSFWFQVSGADTIVHVNKGGGSPAGVVQFSRGAVRAGILIKTCDGCRVENVDLLGFCNTNSDNTIVMLAADFGNSNACVFSNCGIFYGGSSHTCIQYNSLQGAGGTVVYDRLISGLMVNPSSGEGALITSYNAFGGQEMLVIELDAKYGTLPVFGQNALRGKAYYCHTDGAHDIGLALVWGCTTRAHTYGCKTNGNIGSAPPFSTGSLYTEEYRAWVISEVMEENNGTRYNSDDINFIRINCNIVTRPLAIADGNRASDSLWSPATRNRKCVHINCFYGANLINQVGGVNAILTYATANVNDNEPITWFNCHQRWYNHSTTCNFAWHTGSGAASAKQIGGKRMFNCIVSVEYNTGGIRQQITDNAAPDLSMADGGASGHAGCSFWSASFIQKSNSGSGGTLRLGYDLGTSFRDNLTVPAYAAAPTPLAQPAVGSADYQSGVTNGPYIPEYDFYFVPRNLMLPSRGPVEPAENSAATVKKSSAVHFAFAD